MDRRLTQRGKERKRQLMDFAATRFAESGYHPTSVAEIVEGMGVGKGVFYWYFASKEELLLEILREAQQDMRRRQQQEMGDSSDPVERLESGIRATMHWLAEHRDLMSLFEFAQADEHFAPLLRPGRDNSMSDVMRHVQEAMVAGRVPNGDPFVVSHAIIGVTNHLARVFILGREEPAEDVAQAAIMFCRSGLLGQRGGAGCQLR